MKADLSSLPGQLRERSYPHYFSVLFAPPAVRPALAALYAFQHEILHIGLQASEPLLGEMRLHYWRESLKAALPGEKTGAAAAEENRAQNGQSPLIKALRAAAEAYNLPAAPLAQLCEAARVSLYPQPVPSCSLFETYSAEVYGVILRNACAVLAAAQNSAAEQEPLVSACRHGGMMQAVAALARNLPSSARRGKQPVPQDMAHSLGLDWDEFCCAALGRRQAGKQRPGAPLAAEQRLRQALAAYFHRHYRCFKRAQRRLPAALRPAFLPLAALPRFVRLAEKQKHSLLLSAPRVSRLSQQGNIARAALFNSF